MISVYMYCVYVGGQLLHGWMCFGGLQAAAAYYASRVEVVSYYMDYTYHCIVFTPLS